MSGDPRLALLIGYDQMGAVKPLAQLLRRYGRDRVVALVNRPELLPELAGEPGLSLRRVDNILDAAAIVDSVRGITGFDGETPFLCVQDRPTLAYLLALEQLWGKDPRMPHVPRAGVRHARLKPCARELWNRAGVDMTCWTMRTGDAAADGRWDEIGRLVIEPARRYVVKPICGMASELVQLCDGASLDTVVAATRESLRQSPDVALADYTVMIGSDVRRYSPSRDVLIEEALEGGEFTVDGFVVDGMPQIAVQQKEFRIVAPFFGDGLIVSPPAAAPGGVTASPSSLLRRETAAPCRSRTGDFHSLLQRGLQAIELDDWVFHAEVMETPHGLRFVELNPRPPGGLLSRTAALHLGQDLFEVLVRRHLRIPTLASRPGWVTGQLPLYADRVGTIASIEGLDAARALPGVEFVQQVVWPGNTISRIDRENYIAFFCLHAPDHDQVHALSRKVQALVAVRWQDN